MCIRRMRVAQKIGSCLHPIFKFKSVLFYLICLGVSDILRFIRIIIFFAIPYAQRALTLI